MSIDVKSLLAEIEFEVHVEGHKSSEGDGRTAADIEREQAAQKREGEHGTERRGQERRS